MISFSYIVESSFSLLLFWGMYRLCLERLTFFAWNRFYLVGALLFSVIMPLGDYSIYNFATTDSLETISQWPIKAVIVSQRPSYSLPTPDWVTFSGLISTVYWLLAGYYLIKLTLDIRSVFQLIHRYPSQSYGNNQIVWVPDPIPSSSFFRYIFLNENQWQKEVMATVIRHEQVHSQQWHTLDWLLIRLIRALFWFNPLVRCWQRAIAMNHEYLADAQTVKASDPYYYAHLLVNLATPSSNISLLHNFSYRQLKSRIIMLNQIRTKAIHRMRFLLAAPLMLLLLSIVSCENSLNSDLVKPSISPTGAFLFKDLIGTWTSINQTTINEDDGKMPRVFPERAGDLPICASKLVLGADGQFQMLDERNGQSWSGTWQSDKVGVSVELHYFEPSLSSAANSKFLIYNRDGLVANNRLPKVISLDVTSLKAGKMEAWQSYAATGDLSGGQVYYVYQKQ